MGNRLETFYQVETLIYEDKDEWSRSIGHYATIEEAGEHWNLKSKTVRVVKVTEHIIEEVVKNA